MPKDFVICLHLARVKVYAFSFYGVNGSRGGILCVHEEKDGY